jgi:hypothetical protein
MQDSSENTFYITDERDFLYKYINLQYIIYIPSMTSLIVCVKYYVHINTGMKKGCQ